MPLYSEDISHSISVELDFWVLTETKTTGTYPTNVYTSTPKKNNTEQDPFVTVLCC
jgi:hypothetical protein